MATEVKNRLSRGFRRVRPEGHSMHYQVTFRLAGDERTEAVDAPDAASAVNQTQIEYGRGDDLFELISVQLDAPVESDDELFED
jgi:hypothetical protein